MIDGLIYICRIPWWWVQTITKLNPKLHLYLQRVRFPLVLDRTPKSGMTRIKTWVVLLLAIPSMLTLGILINITEHEDLIFYCCISSQNILYCSLLKFGVQKLILVNTHIHVHNRHTYTNQYYCRIVESN